MKTKVLVITIIAILLVGGGVGAYLLLKDNDDVGVIKTTKTDEVIEIEEKNSKLEEEKQELEKKIEELQLQLDNTTSTSSVMSEEEALKIATEVYHKAYETIDEGIGLVDFNKTYEQNGEEYIAVKINVLNNLFTKRNVEVFKNGLINADGSNYYCSRYSGKIAEFIGTIFGCTDQTERPLKIVAVTENKIIATGQVTKSPSGETDTDSYPRYIIFAKENGKWLIDLYE